MPTPSPDRRVLAALVLGSAGITAFQIGLMRLFSFVQWYHFAYMMVSLALLGFGASGALLTWTRRLWANDAPRAAGIALATGAAAMPLSTALLAWEPLRFDLYLLFVEPIQLPLFALGVFLLFLPFLAGAAAIGILLTRHADEAGGYYFANLLGTAAGGAVGLLLATTFLPGRLPALAGSLLLLGGLFLVRRRTLAWLCLPAAVILFLAVRPPEWTPSPFKSLGQVLAMPRAEVVEASPGVKGLFHSVEAPALHPAPGLSLNYRGGIPQGPAFFLDGNWYGMRLPPPEAGEGGWEEATTGALPYWMNPPPGRVLVVGLEGGSPVRLAAHHGAQSVLGVDSHPTVVNRIAGAWSGKRDVRFRAAAPRVVLARGGEPFDLIRFPTIGSFHGGVGLHSLGAEFLLTREAFASAWSRLSDSGAIAATAWLDYPERKPLRLLRLFVAAAREAGVAEPTRHLAAVRGWGALTIVLQKRPVSPDQAARVREECRRWSFDPFWLGGRETGDRERHHDLGPSNFFRIADAILAGDRDTLENYPFVLAPPTDARPFFSQFLRPRSLLAMQEAFAARSLPFFELGTFVLLLTLALLVLFAALFILAPRRRLASGSGSKWPVVLYFGALGLGFLGTEIVLMQVFHLVWGDPVLAAGGTIAGMLFFAGVGSLVSGRFRAGPRSIGLCGSLVAAILLLAAASALPLARFLNGLPPVAAYPLSLALLALVAFPMGGMFPLGLRRMAERRREQIPWAWGINGALSVVASPLALLTAVTAGFPAVFLAAAACYAVAALAIRRL